jgi:hypothetical protein
MPDYLLVNQATTPWLSKSVRSAFGTYTAADLENDMCVIHVRQFQYKSWFSAQKAILHQERFPDYEAICDWNIL